MACVPFHGVRRRSTGIGFDTPCASQAWETICQHPSLLTRSIIFNAASHLRLVLRDLAYSDGNGDISEYTYFVA